LHSLRRALAEGLLVGDTVRCPWHHACFSLRTGVAERPPALNGRKRWRVEQRDGMASIGEELAASKPPTLSAAGLPESVVIVGGGAAGNAEPDWIPLRPAEFSPEHNLDLKLGARVVAIDSAARTVALEDGSRISYGSLLLATGAEPIRLDVLGAALQHVRVLRTLADCDALIARAATARRGVVVGASFIGLDVAASLRTRGLEVHIIAPEARPMERIMGPVLGDMVRAIHEAHGVNFHLGATVAAIADSSVTLSSGEQLIADLVVVGIGVRPAVALAEQAGLAVDRDVVVNEFLQTSAPDIYAAGDIARWPDRLTGQSIRVEHWVVAERQGQVAARNMRGRQARFDAVPFLWSQHYDTTIAYVGHAEQWDRLDIDGDPAARDCAVGFWHQGKKLAVATVGRDRDSLTAEFAFEQAIAG
jgi:NADPH-dependent 2,4-dienoyl-CoA reductase/sulfur reductase-like enzyme